MKKNNHKKHLAIIAAFVLSIFLILAAFIVVPFALKSTTKTNNPQLFITFDDGPGEDTSDILSTLKSENYSAVFFITCKHISEDEIMLVKKISDDGHIVGVHGNSHRILQTAAEISACKEMLENITGQNIVYFRPPYGIVTPMNLLAAQNSDMQLVLWSVFPRDYNANCKEEISTFIDEKYEPGSIILLHDGPAERRNTAEALPQIIRTVTIKNMGKNNTELYQKIYGKNPSITEFNAFN